MEQKSLLGYLPIIIPFLIGLQALLFFGIRSFVRSWYAKKNEDYRAQLRKEALGHEIQTQKISEISSELVELKNTWQSLTQVFHVGKLPDEAILMQKAISSAKSLSYVYETNRYILTTEICALMDKLFSKINQAWHDYYLSRMIREPDMVVKSTELFNDANRIANDEIPRIIEQIQAKFREIYRIK